MQLNSLTYIAFFVCIYLIYRVMPRRFQNMFLLIASYVFYAWWDIRFLFLVILSTVLNYCSATVLRNGAIGIRQRATLSIWIILAYALTVLIGWDQFSISREASTGGINWLVFVSGSSPGIWTMFVMLLVAVLLSNVLYSRVALFDERSQKKLYLVLGVSCNIIILGFFKYYSFFLDNLESFLSIAGINLSGLRLDIVLPVGISFYTFRGISYIVDAYRSQVRTEHSFSDIALYMAFFPSILAGPIDRVSAFLWQIHEKRNLSWDQSIRGVHLFLFGLFKKVVIADGVVKTVSSVFDSTARASWIDVVVATALFTIQIYCDFSGYTDMARGTAKVLGIDLMVNFRLPYFSRNPRDFWSRWHISLSTWLRDYLYIPLGGNRKGRARTYINLVVTMVLGGLWHGAAWNFILWGLYHGIVLSIHRAIISVVSRDRNRGNIVVNTAKVMCCLIAVCYGWLLFRAPSLDRIVTLTSTLVFDFGNMDLGATWPKVAALLGLPIFLTIEAVEKLGEGKPFYQKVPIPVWTALYASMVFCTVIGLTTESAQFIYMVF